MNRSRIIWLVFSLGITVLSSGCFFARRDPLPEVLIPNSTLDQVTAAINQNTANAKQLSSSVNLQMDGVPARLKGNFALEQPKNLRIDAGLAGISELGVDIGSNDETFWVWSKASVGGAEPMLLFARHDEFARSPASRTLPIQPQWIVQSLGLIEFESGGQHEGPFPAQNGWLEIRSKIQSPRGWVTRVVNVNGKTGAIERVSFYDEQNQIIAFANASRYEYYPEHQVRLPRHVEIVFLDPERNKIRLAIEFGKFNVNNNWGDPALLWKMPQPGDVKTLDLSKAHLISQQSGQNPNRANQQRTPQADANGLPVQMAEPPRGYQYR